ncbi:polysaccharide deacetylase family protein [Clostridium kluyveri]|uniref:Predicted deacetylase n=2 Tax=Clostridium kluyveri TaxID=1534 RepID=A5N3R1_CLOK5|nr:polysaccharide deacetylase family protein [Clostridium kluyveri]EDK35757.1 Predicted deacetylase [Clostridium kluyveri DSM 555]BAH08386.1 hypothetical protein CKR_3335 [Clostridium kluyveri NBRC 12016]
MHFYYRWKKKSDVTENLNSNQIESHKEKQYTNQVVDKDNQSIEGNLIYNSQSIPVLYYHSIDYEKGNELRIPKEKFRQQMQYLKDNKYTTLSLDEFYNFLVNNNPVPNKSVIITFDDGYKDNYENAFPILKEFGFRATIFVITSTIDKEKDFLTSNELKEMSSCNIGIESHTVNHDNLNSLDYDAQIKTLKDSKEFLERILGKEVKYIAYPYGKWNENTLKAVKSAGYNMAFTTIGGWSNKDQGLYTLNRVYVSNNHNMDEFKRRLTNSHYEVSN